MKRTAKMAMLMTAFLSLSLSAYAGYSNNDAQTNQASKTAPKKERSADEAVKATEFTLPAGVRSENVEFDGAGLKLAGTLLLPKVKQGERIPAVLIFAATPFTPRDGVVAGKNLHYTYRDLAAHLVARGYAVLRFDYRCVGTSGCLPRSPVSGYNDDAHHALEYLRSRAEVDPKRIAVFGHGDGALIATAIFGDNSIAGVILASASGRTGDKLLRERAARYLAERNVPEAERRVYLTNLEKMMNRFKTGNVDLSQEKIDPQDEFLAQVVKYSDFIYSWIQDDPLQGTASLSVPVLILQGEKDTQMSSRDAHYLEDALKRGENNDVTMHIFPNVDHALKTNKGVASLKTDQDVSRPLDPEVLNALNEWLDKKLKK
ncbi:MAG TPA: alpha/beta fold hydrolase [Blastocatellia bacterium]|nr:alpha/beta fold hydrolase [Blastocatellia bacterium]